MYFETLDNQRAEIMQKFDFDNALSCMTDRNWTYRGQPVSKIDLMKTASDLLMQTCRSIEEGLRGELEENRPFEAHWVSTSTGRFTAFAFKMHNGQWRLQLNWGLEQSAATIWD